MASNCTGGQAACWIASQVDILKNITASLAPIERLITGTAYLMGLAFGVKALYTLKMYGESRTMMSSNTNMKEPLLYFLVAAMLIYLPTGVEYVMNTTFGYSSPLAYAPVNSKNSALDTLFGQDSAIGASLAMIIQVIGVVAFIRGWVLIARSGSQGQSPGGMGKGLVHVFGGILAMNIVGTLEIINNTLYGTG